MWNSVQLPQLPQRQLIQTLVLVFKLNLWRGARTRDSLTGGPEPSEKEIHEILGSKREDRFSDPFFDSVQNTSLGRF